MKLEEFRFEAIEAERLPEGITEGYRYMGDSLVVARIGEPLLDQIRNVSASEDGLGTARILQMDFDCHYLLLTWDESEEVRMMLFSDEKRVRALEFMDFLISDCGLAKGNAMWASGTVSSAILKVQMSMLDLQCTMEYLFKMCFDYFENCDWIDAETYIRDARDLTDYRQCRKRRTGWAVVRTLDLVPAGEELRLKSLENESGIVITAGEDTYVMIGCRGEIYDITREKFENTYEVTDKPLDIYEHMLDFLPEVQRVRNASYIELDEFARICYPKKDSGVFVRELSKRTKVFPMDETQEYYLGREGDYIAVRPDDYQDVYVIQRDIFKETYEEE